MSPGTLMCRYSCCFLAECDVIVFTLVVIDVDLISMVSVISEIKVTVVIILWCNDSSPIPK